MSDVDTPPATATPVPPASRADPGAPTDHAGLRVMGLDECLGKLDEAPVGRLAFPLDGEIAVLPVNHLLDGLDVCFRTAGGSKIQAAVDGDTVSYQVDHWDVAARSGWSVLVHGTASVVTDEDAIARLASRAHRPWVRLDTHDARWVKVSARQVSGRMILPD